MKHVEEHESDRGTRDVEQPPENPRIRYAKRELAKVLSALETVDGDELTKALRVIHLEEQLSDTKELAARWRRCYEAVCELIACTGSNPDFDRIDQIMREWIGKA